MSQRTTPPDVLDTDRQYVRTDPASDQRMSTTVALAVADREGVAPTALPPLGYATDPDALDTFVATDAVDGEITFTFAGYDVTVHPCGLAELDPREGANA